MTNSGLTNKMDAITKKYNERVIIKVDNVSIEPQSIIDESLEEIEFERYVKIGNLNYPIKNDLCPQNCGKGWASTLYSSPPLDMESFPMPKDGKTVYAVPPKFTWYSNYVYHRECLESKLGKEQFDLLVKSGEIITE